MYSKVVHRALLAIRENITLARGFAAGMTFDSFRSDQRSIHAVTRCLEIISEASRRLPAVPWPQIGAAGNIYRHKYDNVSPSMLWTTVEGGLDDIEAAVAVEIAAMEKLDFYESRRTPPE